MKVSINWLNTYVPVKEPDKLPDLFSIKSQEVESMEKLVVANKLVIGRVTSCIPHKDADKLSLCQVDVGDDTLNIVCGAPNVKKGQKVIVALPGAVLPGAFKIKKTMIRGIESNGMICSLNELGIEQKYHYETGIHVIEDDTVNVGDDALKALQLDDWVMTLDLTPNRADLLSMHGVAYDYAAMVEAQVTIPQVIIKTSDKKNPMTITTETKDCMSYYGRVIEDMTIKKSPAFMRARLIAAGIRPINNIVDITNYVMLETGQPLHAFDYDLLDSETIVVRNARDQETFTTLDDKVRKLNPSDIVITNGQKAIALGGVMGGAETEVHNGTKRILLESASFNPIAIRKTSRRLDLRSESSMRFERGIDIGMTQYALDRACELFIKYADATVREGIAYFDHHDKADKTIDITLETINKVLGSNYSMTHVENLLKRLVFPYKKQKDGFVISCLTRRHDITTYQDIIEEIGRISGYNALEDTLPKTVSTGALSPYQSFKRVIRHALASLGLYETITYSLIDSEAVHDYTKDDKIKPVVMKNPISEHRNTLTLTPINGLLEVMRHNFARQQTAVHIFEIGKAYSLKQEDEKLTIAMCGPYRDHGWQKTPPTNFYTLKAVFEALLNRLKIDDATYQKATRKNMHPHQTAGIKYKAETIGFIGKLHPKAASPLDLKDVFLLEVDLKKLFEASLKPQRFESLQRYPSVERDIAIVCNKYLTAQETLETIRQVAGKKLKDAMIFDVYTGDHVGDDEKSLGIRMMFEDTKKTLETSEVDGLVEGIILALKKTHGASLR